MGVTSISLLHGKTVRMGKASGLLATCTKQRVWKPRIQRISEMPIGDFFAATLKSAVCLLQIINARSMRQDRAERAFLTVYKRNFWYGLHWVAGLHFEFWVAFQCNPLKKRCNPMDISVDFCTICNSQNKKSLAESNYSKRPQLFNVDIVLGAF